MKLFYKLVSQLLVVCMILLPYSAHAGVIGTDQAIAGAQDLANRDKVTAFMNRGEVVKQLEALGINAATARERVNALTQEEINRIAGKIDTAPAGAMINWWIGTAVVLIALILWWAYMNPAPLPPGGTEATQKGTADRIITPMPSNQVTLLRRFEEACRSYAAQPNEIRKSEVLRGTASFYSEVGKVEGWVGTLKRISTYQGSSNTTLVIKIGTSNVYSNVRIGSPAYNSAANMREGQDIIFSGQGLRDFNLTERGTVCNPNFKIDLTSLRHAP